MPSRYFSMSFENNVASFRIQSVMKQDSGEYTFKVENDFGSSSCDAYLRITRFVLLAPSSLPYVYMYLINKWQQLMDVFYCLHWTDQNIPPSFTKS